MPTLAGAAWRSALPCPIYNLLSVCPPPPRIASRKLGFQQSRKPYCEESTTWQARLDVTFRLIMSRATVFYFRWVSALMLPSVKA